MRCSNCGSDNREGAKFCNECAAPLPLCCPSCGTENRPSAKFCNECATPLTGEETGKLRNAETGKQEKTQDTRRQTLDSRREGERRQLTVMFCDLVGSTPLSERLDPEDLREVVREYQAVCEAVIHRFEGYIARYVGDGLLVYFGYPVAHEDDAQRAVRTGLDIAAVLPSLSTRLQSRLKVLQDYSLQVRIGIHTGLVVVGEMGGSDYREAMALGETPNIAARLQGIAEPDTVVVSAATYRLIAGLFECYDLGPQTLKGVTVPLTAYRVLSESGIRSRFDVAVKTGLTPLVGRDHEVGLLRERWERAKQGEGQVVLLSGEPGIGKSRLVQEFKDQLAHERVTHVEFRCSPYYQHSALYPIIDHLQRFLQFARDDAPAVKLEKLQRTLSHYRFPQADTLPLLAALLSLPHPEGAPPIMLSPQKQKQKTQEAFVAWMVEEAERAAVYCAWEDLHWADPSTLEVLTLFLDQVPTARLLALLTFRPEFTPPWSNRSHLSQLTLSRLGRRQVEVMVERVTGGKALPREVVQHIVAKTDGVPLFVEELTKSVVESVGAIHELPLQLGIPTTLHDALMARLDRLGMAKAVAQLGATLGREFSYEVLQMVSPLDEETLQHGLKQLVEAELLYQRGLVPQAHYLFKHALIQDTASQSLLKSTRQQYHRQIAQVLEERFTETVEAQPELVAHHYTEAGLIQQAISYWQQAGERASQRSAYVEAIAHLTKGLGFLITLLDTPKRAQQELALQLALSSALMTVKGYTAPEVGKIVLRVQELCQQLGETPQLFPVLYRQWTFYFLSGELQTARELAEQMLRLSQSVQNQYQLALAHSALGWTLYQHGELPSARTHAERTIALYDPRKHPRSAVNALDPRVDCLSYGIPTLWLLGYPDQALQKSHEALTLAQNLTHPYSLGWALCCAAWLHQSRREPQETQARMEAVITFSNEHGFPLWLAYGTVLRGWALAMQGHEEEGVAQIHEGMTAWRALGTEMARTHFLALLAEAYGNVGRSEEGLRVLSEALEFVEKTGEQIYEAELYRLKGTLTLKQSEVRGPESEVINPQHLAPNTQAEVEACFQKAIEIARQQQAKSLELRAVMSLSRLWQQQGKKDEARQLLADIYGWFTEGFDTKDLQEAKALLEELSQ